MSLRQIALLVLGVLGVGVLGLMAYLAWWQGSELEAAGWLAAGFLALREVVSKIENIALGLRAAEEPEETGEI